MRHQQSLTGRRIAIAVLNSRFIRWADIAPLAPQVQRFLDEGPPEGAFVVIDP